jgi:hypothetical protein
MLFLSNSERNKLADGYEIVNLKSLQLALTDATERSVLAIRLCFTRALPDILSLRLLDESTVLKDVVTIEQRELQSKTLAVLF